MDISTENNPNGVIYAYPLNNFPNADRTVKWKEPRTLGDGYNADFTGDNTVEGGGRCPIMRSRVCRASITDPYFSY